MAVRRIINTIDALAVGRDPQSIRGDQQLGVRSDSPQSPLVGVAAVRVVAGTGAMVDLGGQAIGARFATDEPLRPGQQVWLIRADDGTYLILGSVK